MTKKTKRIRIYISSTDTYQHEPLYRMLIRTARELGMAGATVYNGVMGFGSSSDPKASSPWNFSDKVPVTVEIIDTEDNITDFLNTARPTLEKQPKGCMMTLEDVEVLFTKRGTAEKK